MATSDTSTRSIPAPGTGIWLVPAAAGALAGVVLVTTSHLPAPLHAPSVPWWALALAFYAAECLVVDLQLRRETYCVSLAEVPLVLGLFAASPPALIVAQLAGSGSALAFYRRRGPLSTSLDLGRNALTTALAVAVFRAIVGGHDPFGPSGWLAALAAASLASATGLVLGAAARRLSGERFSAGRLTGAATVSFAATLTAASLGAVTATLAATRASAVALLLLPAAACMLALRAYASQHRRQDQVQSLFDSIPRRMDSSELGSGVRQLLIAARRLLHAERAEILIFPADAGERPLRSSAGPHHERLLEPSDASSTEQLLLDRLRSRDDLVTIRRGRRPAEFDHYLAERGLGEAIVTTLEGEDRVLGLAVVGDRPAGGRAFGQEDEKLFRTFAGHAALLLENELLEQSLARLAEQEAKLRHEALHDALTGLPNRRLFHARVTEALQRSDGSGREPVVLFLDLDGFKAINDELGHAAGDELLVAFAERLRGNVRPEELPARLGGDEFAVLIEAGGHEVAEDVAERLVEAVRDPFSVHGRRLSVRLSIGIAAGAGVGGVEELLANADLAMYEAKSEGTSSYARYAEGLRGSAQARRALGDALEEALERDQITVHYQPIVDLSNGATVSFEALARWRRGRSDTIEAADFLSAAEEGELMERLGRVVLRAACVQTQEWRVESEPPRQLSICVNLSPLEFAGPRLGVDVAAALLESGLDAGRLILEVTEQVAAEHPESTLATMSELRRLGVRFALDEFGTGPGSLERLCRLPFDVVKIARPLVERIGASPRSADDRLVRAVVAVARPLGLKVVAGGIETREQAARLRELGCPLGQGFYFDRALAVPQATHRLRTPASVPLRLVAAESA